MLKDRKTARSPKKNRETMWWTVLTDSGGILLGGWWLRGCVLEMWSSIRWQRVSEDRGERRDQLSANLLGVRPRDEHLLSYPPGILKSWDIDIQESIFRDMAVNIPDKLSRVRFVWNLFDDSSPLGKTILGKLSSVIDKYTEGKGLPSFSGMSRSKVELAEELWKVVKATLEVMVVSRVERKGLDEIRRSHRLGGESDLSYLLRMHLLFHAVGRREEESEVVSIIFGRLAHKWQNRILEIIPLETLIFENLIDSFKIKGRQEKYKGLKGMRLGVNHKAASTSQVP